MKKLFTITLSIIMCISCFALFGCSKAKGEWVLKAVEAGNVTINLGEEYDGVVLKQDSVKLSIQDDDVAVLTYFGSTKTGTWSEAPDDEIMISFSDGRTYFAELDDGELEITISYVKYILRKA